MALNTFKCNCLTPLHFKGLTHMLVHIGENFMHMFVVFNLLVNRYFHIVCGMNV